MNNEVRKPQDWWIYEQYNQAADLGIIRMATKERFSKENREQFSETHCKEILPGDDSLRERTIPISDVKEMLEDFRSDAKRMRGEFHRLYEEINNLIKHIERENPPKQGEGK